MSGDERWRAGPAKMKPPGWCAASVAALLSRPGADDDPGHPQGEQRLAVERGARAQSLAPAMANRPHRAGSLLADVLRGKQGMLIAGVRAERAISRGVEIGAGGHAVQRRGAAYENSGNLRCPLPGIAICGRGGVAYKHALRTDLIVAVLRIVEAWQPGAKLVDHANGDARARQTEGRGVDAACAGGAFVAPRGPPSRQQHGRQHSDAKGFHDTPLTQDSLPRLAHPQRGGHGE